MFGGVKSRRRVVLCIRYTVRTHKITMFVLGAAAPPPLHTGVFAIHIGGMLLICHDKKNKLKEKNELHFSAYAVA